MDADRSEEFDAITEPIQLKNQNNAAMKTEGAPTAAFFNGRIWMAYRTTDHSRIIVGCRTSNDLEKSIYEEYDLNLKFPDGPGKSNEPPAIVAFKQRLYIFWKASTGFKPGNIVYTSTEDGSQWNDLQRIPVETKLPAAVVAYGDRIYLAYLSNQSTPAPIDIISTSDGQNWSSPTTQLFGANETNPATAAYSPCFSVSNNRLVMFWNGKSDVVQTAPLNTAGIDGAKTSNNAVTTNLAPSAPETLVEGKWQTKIGSAAVYNSQQQWIITTSKGNGEISIATGDDFDKRFNLTGQSSKAKSSNRCAVCLIPGFFGRKYSQPWRIALIFRGFGPDASLKELFIDL